MPIDPTILAGGIAAGAQLTATAGNAYSTGRMNKKNRKFAQQMYEQQKNDNIYLWNMQNDYNNPANQMKRLKEAGLNPHLVYGQGAVANNASAPEGGKYIAPEQTAPQIDPGAVGDSIGTYFDLRMKPLAMDAARQHNANLQKEGALKDAQILHTLAQTGNEISHTKMNEFDLGYKTETRNTQASVLDAQLQKLRTDIDFTTDQNVRNQAMHNQTILQMEDHLKNTQIGRDKTREEIREISQKIINLKMENKIKEFESYLNSLGLTPHDDAKLRKLIMSLNPPQGRVSARTGNRIYHQGASNNDRKTRYWAHD